MADTNKLWTSDEPPSGGDRLLIASGEAGARQIDLLPTDVPPRGPLRRNWHRERFCAVALIRHLSKVRQHLFPLAIERVDSPDFVFAPPQPASSIAVEMTDAGGTEFIAWLDQIAACRDVKVHGLPSPKGGGWQGDAPNQAFAAALDQAILRKLDAINWRNAADLPRWLVLYDNTNAGGFVSNTDAEACLRDQARRRRADGLDTLVLVRPPDLVWMVECC